MTEPVNDPSVPRQSLLAQLRTLVRRAIGGIAALVAVGAIAWLAIAWLWPDADPASRWDGRFTLVRFYLRVFQLQLGLGIVAASLVAIVCRFWRVGTLCLLAGLAALLPYAREYVPKPVPAIAGKPLRILSVNIFAVNRDGDAMLREIRAADPDVIVACEVTGWAKKNVFAQLEPAYPFRVNPDDDGAAIVFSRVPFTTDRKVRPMPQRNPLIFQLEGGEVALYPVHTTSPGGRDHLMRNRTQMRQLAEILRRETRATVIAGDFNATPLSPNFQWLLATGARTSHDWAGFGVGHTWGPRWHAWLNRLPGIRIDHIVLSPDLAAVSHRVGPDVGSDHRPIIAEIGFRTR